jgi:hypothetical protein
MRFAVVIVVALFAASCAGVSPVGVNAGDQCFRCRQIIVQPKLAGEIIDTNGNVLKFRTPACMAQFVTERQGATYQAIYVTDYPTGKLVRASTVTFVRAQIDDKTNARDYLAFKNVDQAAEAARKGKESVIDWSGLVTRVANTKTGD